MKKVFVFLLSMGVAGMFVSCSDVLEIPDVTSSGEQGIEQPVAPDKALSGDVTFTGTWASLPGGTQPVWAGGDKILLSDGKSVTTLTNAADGGVVAKFPARVADGSTAFLAISPAAEGISLEGQKINFTLPSTQQADAIPDAGVAKSSGTQLFFSPILSRVVFSPDFDGATKVVFKTSESIVGDVEVDYSGETPVLSATATEVVVTGTFEKGKSYSFCILPVQLEDYAVEVYVGDVVKAHISGGAVETKAGSVTEIPPFSLDIPTYRISAIKVWGGTGPQYGSTKVFNLYEKAICFNDEDGRGIDALKDNYLLMKEDGTFVNYAGVDGRNWWFVFSGSQNTVNGKDIDLRSFYDVLPLSEGTWSVEGNAVTLTKADGTSRQGQWLAAGTYPMPGTTPQLSATLEKEALMFPITGGKDDWNGSNPWNNYGVIAANPRALFIEVEKMPDGFVVPEESRTFDADFEYIPPVDPVTEFDWESLSANWNVYGGNSSPFGIFVLGGSGDDPAFVSPIDKSWDWDDSIWWESDNGLNITLTGLNGTVISGTANWWAGNDGKFWNYTWKPSSDNIDCSQFFNKIPKGSHTFTLDVVTRKMEFETGAECTFLTPGEHEFVYGKVLTVPDGCFALSFHNMDPIAATSSRWTDIDRFVYAPLEYVIIFATQ